MSPLPCPRPNCGGNLYLEADAADEVFDLKCLCCGRSPRQLTRAQLADQAGAAGLKRAEHDSFAFVWNRRP